MSNGFNRKTSYHWYLGHEFWRERREHILKRANFTCEKCGQRPATEVHHLTYIRVFQELPSDLLAVCRHCHAEISLATAGKRQSDPIYVLRQERQGRRVRPLAERRSERRRSRERSPRQQK